MTNVADRSPRCAGRTRWAPRLCAALGAIALAGCAAEAAREASGGAGASPSAAAGPSASVPAAAVATLVPPSAEASDEPEFRGFSVDGVNGGEVRFTVAGSPDDLLAMILDFDHEAGRRPWRARMKLLDRAGNVHRAEAEYEGGGGINPTVVMRHEVEALPAGYRVSFRLETTDFGLATFTGEYEMTRIAGGRCEFRERVLIDSGIPFINASADEVRLALLQDAADIRRWMADRLVNAAPAGGGTQSELVRLDEAGAGVSSDRP